MTTNKPEVKRFHVDCNGLRVGGSPRDECDVLVVLAKDYEALQAECEKLRKDAELGRSVLSKREPGKVYGCHCDLEEGMEPDGCVIDSNEHLLCNYATHIEVKEQCSYWRVIAIDTAIQEDNPC